ncbi:permease prefix domain 1-containing protein [Microbacterium luticocti]|uniref:permease prefix domain 1-containing protein n=1 Tax=Microbacterium luticocti TaxID=451764 RepID=UPI0004118EE9|nr:permease prefix domain 1-containing protein [Microbacterium luticocti]
MDDIETRIGQWRGYLSRRAVLHADDVAELEGHLRDQIERLEASGLSADEAFLIGVTRIGRINDLAGEYAREHSDRLWKHLVLDETPEAAGRNGALLAIGLAVAAAVAIKLPALFGVDATGQGAEFYLRNVGLLVLPFVATFFLVRRRASVATIVTVAAGFVAAAVVMNAYPFAPAGQTAVLAGIHVLLALWLVAGIAYADGDVRSTSARMDVIRFSGEWFVYLVLLVLGGGVLSALTFAVFASIGLSPAVFVAEWLIPCGGAAAVVVAAWLVEAKQSVIENIAPVLTRVFTPLFTLLLLAFIVAASLHGSFVEDGRELLILFDAVLLVVVALLLYSISARTSLAPPTWFEKLQLLMIAAALVVDVFVLVAMVGRIGEYGASANKLASLGVNLILVANLAGAGWHHLRFVRGTGRFETVERWQTGFLPVYLAWAAVVVIVFPPVFGFV